MFVAFLGAGALLTVVFFFTYFGSPEFTDVGYRPEQPVEYSHKLHAGELGIDCRYCHTSVETSQEAMIPPTQTCMNCHSVVDIESKKLEKVRESWNQNKPIEWIRVHMLPDYAYFDHSIHLTAGVGCASCHGRVDQMEKVMQVEPLSMSWCLDCHRNPENHLRPIDQITNMDWEPSNNHHELVDKYIEDRNISPPEDCTACHR